MNNDTIKQSAIKLMAMALAMLDRIDEKDAALHLQQAINTATGAKPFDLDDEIPLEMLERLFPRRA